MERIDWIQSVASNCVAAAKRIVVAVHVVVDTCFVVAHSSNIHCVIAAHELEEGS